MLYYIAMRVKRWEDIECSIPGLPLPPSRLSPIPGTAGVILVFESVEALQKEYPDTPFSVLKALE